MATNWTKRGHMIITKEGLAAANKIAETIQAVMETSEDQANTFSIPLSTDGKGTETHIETNTALTEDMATAWLVAEARGDLPGIKLWIKDAFTEELINTNTADTLEQKFTRQDALGSANLQVIKAEII